MLSASESVLIEVHVSLRGNAGAFSGGVLLGPFRGKLFRGDLLYGVNKDAENGSKAQKWLLGGCKIVPYRELLHP